MYNKLFFNWLCCFVLIIIVPGNLMSFSLTHPMCRRSHFNNFTVDSLMINNACGWPAL